MVTYDLIVLGGGPAGYLAAERAAQGGLTVCLFEQRSLGGVCLNEGCIPSKALLHSAKVHDYAAHGEAYGVHAERVSMDHPAVVRRKDKVVKTLVSGVAATLKGLGVTVVPSHAAVTGKSAGGYAVESGGQAYEGRRLLIATGSQPVLPPIPGVAPGLEDGFVLTNREILSLSTLPQRLVVIGGGVIGLEMASYFNSAGCQVTVVEMLDKIAGPTEAEISSILLKNYQKKGVTFKLGCRVTGVAGGKVLCETDGRAEELEADKVLLSIGRRAVTAGVGLESIGVYTERGAVVTDAHMQTNLPGVYAAGDVNGKSMLAHTAYREAEVAVNHMLGRRDVMRYEAIPSVIYTSPEVAGVGETEETARDKGMEVKTAKVSMRYSGRYLAETEGGDGICKLVAEAKTNRLVGAHMIGSYCSEMIYGAGLMIESHWPIEDIKELVFPHPTVCEVVREALFEL